MQVVNYYSALWSLNDRYTGRFSFPYNWTLVSVKSDDSGLCSPLAASTEVPLLPHTHWGWGDSSCHRLYSGARIAPLLSFIRLLSVLWNFLSTYSAFWFQRSIWLLFCLNPGCPVPLSRAMHFCLLPGICRHVFISLAKIACGQVLHKLQWLTKEEKKISQMFDLRLLTT